VCVLQKRETVGLGFAATLLGRVYSQWRPSSTLNSAAPTAIATFFAMTSMHAHQSISHIRY
jgi:hypothetical protein